MSAYATIDEVRAYLARLARDHVLSERDDRLCREIVARGICAPTSDLGIAVRATLSRVDSLRELRAYANERWERAEDASRAFEAETQGACNDSQRLASELVTERTTNANLRAHVVELRKRLDVAESAPPHTASGDALAACMRLLGVKTYAGLTAGIKALRDETDTLRGIHRDMLRVVGERDEARRELVALRESVRNVARRMAEQISEVSQ